MTDQPPDTNKRVAEACGFTRNSLRMVHVEEWFGGCQAFDPATDPAAALFAIKAYCRKWNQNYVLKFYVDGDGSDFECVLFEVCEADGIISHYGDTEHEAICNAIIAAEEARTK